jgi:hypothetical protein
MSEREKKTQEYRPLQNELSNGIFPKGSIAEKTSRGGKKYYYLATYSKDTKKNITKWIKKTELFATKELVNRRKYLETTIRNLLQEIETIDKMLKPLNKHLEKNSVITKLNEITPDQPPTQEKSTQKTPII